MESASSYMKNIETREGPNRDKFALDNPKSSTMKADQF
jgi:hypothetical protein